MTDTDDPPLDPDELQQALRDAHADADTEPSFDLLPWLTQIKLRQDGVYTIEDIPDDWPQEPIV